MEKQILKNQISALLKDLDITETKQVLDLTLNNCLKKERISVSKHIINKAKK